MINTSLQIGESVVEAWTFEKKDFFKIHCSSVFVLAKEEQIEFRHQRGFIGQLKTAPAEVTLTLDWLYSLSSVKGDVWNFLSGHSVSGSTAENTLEPFALDLEILAKDTHIIYKDFRITEYTLELVRKQLIIRGWTCGYTDNRTVGVASQLP